MEGLSKRAKDVIEENGLTTALLLQLTENDINDLFGDCPFMDRFHVRRLQNSCDKSTLDAAAAAANPSNISNITSNDEKPEDVDQDYNESSTASTSVINVSNSTNKRRQYTSADDMLSKKEKRGKASPAQKRFSGLLKDAASAAHIWKRAPREADISERKKELFMEIITEQEPTLKYKKREVWKALCAQLRNRRKYLKDLDCNKRVRKGDKTFTAGHGSLNPENGPKSPNVKVTLSSGNPVLIKDSQNKIIGKGIFLSQKNNMYGEIVVRAVHTNKLDGDVELPEPVDGKTTFDENMIKRVILWKIERLEKEFKQNLKSAKSISTMVQTKLPAIPVNTKIKSKQELSNSKQSKKVQSKKVQGQSNKSLHLEKQRPTASSTITSSSCNEALSLELESSPESSDSNLFKTVGGQSACKLLPRGKQKQQPTESSFVHVHVPYEASGSSESNPDVDLESSDSNLPEKVATIPRGKRYSKTIHTARKSKDMAHSTGKCFSKTFPSGRQSRDPSTCEREIVRGKGEDVKFRSFVLMEWSNRKLYWGILQVVEFTNDTIVRNAVKCCGKVGDSAEEIIKVSENLKLSSSDYEVNPNMDFCVWKLPAENEYMSLVPVVGTKFGIIELKKKSENINILKENLEAYMRARE